MISFPSAAKIYILHDPISFHRQIEGLSAAVRQLMGKDPLSGAYFVFRSRSKQSVRILHFDGSGVWLATKKLSKGCFGRHWPRGPGDFSPLLVRDLQLLLWGGQLASLGGEKNWRHIA